MRPVQQCWTSENLLHKPGRTRVHAGPPRRQARRCSHMLLRGCGTGRQRHRPPVAGLPGCIPPLPCPAAWLHLGNLKPSDPSLRLPSRGAHELSSHSPPNHLGSNPTPGGVGVGGGWLALWPGASHSSGRCSRVPGGTGHDAKSIHLQTWGEQGGSSYPDSIQSRARHTETDEVISLLPPSASQGGARDAPGTSV